MRKLWLGIIGLAAAATANAATVTYTLSLNDNGAGVLTPNNWAVYAEASPDSGGLFAYGVDLTGTFGTFLNRGNGVIMEDSDGTGESRSLGFTVGRTQDAANGKFSGLQDLGAGASLIPVYGIGQRNDDLDNYIPADFETQTSVFGAGRANYTTKFLLGRGTWTGAAPAFQAGSVDLKASTWNSNTGLANSVAQLTLLTQDLGGTAASFTLEATGTKGANQAVGGSIAVTGANNSYTSEVDELLANVGIGNAPIASIGPEAGNVYVMARLNGTAADIAALLGTLTTDVDASDPEFAKLHGHYDSRFTGGSFNALFKFPNSANIRTINWDFGTAAVTVDQLAAVPEPGTMALLGIAGLGLLARRRRIA
jgi:hypothetical protein